MKKVMMGAVCTAIVLSAGSATATPAVVGKPAPVFRATDADGKPISLSDFKGKFVVLEWTNPSCPFVRKHYDSGNMPATQKHAMADGAIWLSIQTTLFGWGADSTRADLLAWQKSKHATPTASIIDSGGKIASSYHATATPNMYIIDPQGTLIYAGAIDSKPSTDQADIRTATNFVSQALNEAMKGLPVSRPVTQAYGCSVKYI